MVPSPTSGRAPRAAARHAVELTTSPRAQHVFGRSVALFRVVSPLSALRGLALWKTATNEPKWRELERQDVSCGPRRVTSSGSYVHLLNHSGKLTSGQWLFSDHIILMYDGDRGARSVRVPSAHGAGPRPRTTEAGPSPRGAFRTAPWTGRRGGGGGGAAWRKASRPRTGGGAAALKMTIGIRTHAGGPGRRARAKGAVTLARGRAAPATACRRLWLRAPS